MNYKETHAILGKVDIYFIDQILKNRYAPPEKILDAGCGEGRNLKWLYANNYKISGADTDIEGLGNAKMIYHKADELEKTYSELIDSKSDTVIAYFYNGVGSAHTTFVLTQFLGYKNAKVMMGLGQNGVSLTMYQLKKIVSPQYLTNYE